MKNLNREILDYVSEKSSRKVQGALIRGRWSDTTASSNYYKLSVASDVDFDPDRLYAKLKNEGCTLYTIQNYFIIAKQFETEKKKTARFKEWMQNNPAAFKNCYKKKEKLMRDEDFKEIISAVHNNADIFNFLTLMGKGGLRRTEALQVRWSDLKDGRLEITNGKGGKQRFIPFDSSWLRRTFTDTIVSSSFRTVGFKVKGFTPHDFRAYYATKIVNIPGMSIEDARDLLGHEKIETTAKYLRANKDKQQKLVMEAFR